MKIIIICIIAYLVYSALKNRSSARSQSAGYAKTFAQIEREHRAFLCEQERQYKEVERLAREQEQQAAQLAKHEQQIENLYFKVEKCEDEIAHFTALADRLTEQRDAMQAEIDSITQRLANADGTLDPLNASRDGQFDGKSGALLYMDMYASTLDNTKTAKQRQTDAEKLAKRRDTLTGKVITLDNRVFAAEQKIKKATHEKDVAEKELSA